MDQMRIHSNEGYFGRKERTGKETSSLEESMLIRIHLALLVNPEFSGCSKDLLPPSGQEVGSTFGLQAVRFPPIL